MAAMNKALLSVVVAAFAAFIVNRYQRLQEITLDSRGPVTVKHLNCHYLPTIEYGAEDISILPDGLAFFSSGLKFSPLPSFSDDPGKIFVLDLLHPKPTPVELKIEGDLDLSTLNPHGVSVYTDEKDDSLYVFVVNHPHKNSQVEIFRYVEENTLVHLKTITHPLLHNVNDIVAVGVESFYATNDRAIQSEMLNFLSVILDLPFTDVVYYSPGEVRVVADGIMAANGINISPDKRYIYVADIVDHDIDVFERQEGEKLVFIKSVDTGSLCDNIDVDPRTGDLWMGCHPSSTKLAQYNPKDPPGSEIIRIQNIHSEEPVVSQEYVDDGRVLMGSTIAARYDKKLFIGSAFHKALYCDFP